MIGIGLVDGMRTIAGPITVIVLLKREVVLYTVFGVTCVLRTVFSVVFGFVVMTVLIEGVVDPIFALVVCAI